MSLLSLVRDPLDYLRPSLILGQHFGMGLHDEDFLEPCLPRRVRRMLLSAPYYARNWQSQSSKKDKGSTLCINKNKFQVSLDVQQFAPEEITVKVSGDTITVEGKHEEKEDDHGVISRHFVRKYTLPQGHNVDLVQSKLSSDGVLTITAPKNDEKKDEREIPIALTGQPSRAIEGDSGDDKKENEKREEKRDARKKK